MGYIGQACITVLQCQAGGAAKMWNTWLIPESAEKPADGRFKSIKSKQNGPKEITYNE